MKTSMLVGYRIYSLKSGPSAIAFHTQRKEFMFLEGLSAELLQLILEDASGKMIPWMEQNGIAEADVDDFKQKLDEFGFFSEAEANKPPAVSEIPYTENGELERRPELNRFMNELRHNGLYYAFHIDLTHRCNEKCVHCYHPFDTYDYSKELSLNEVKELIDIVYELGVFVVTLSGGECLLRPDFFEILDYISSKGMVTNIFTNGMLLTEDVVQKIRRYRVKLVSISLYGDTAEIHDRITTIPGSFERTIQGIERLKKHNIPFELKCVVLAENVGHIKNIRSLAMKLNHGQDCKVDFALCGKLDGSNDPFSHRANAEELKKVLFSDPERYFNASDMRKKDPTESPCGAGKYGLMCSADGSIYPCVSFRLLLCNYKDLPQIADNEILHQWLNTRLCDFSDCFQHDYCDYCPEQCAGNNLIENGNYLDSRNVSNCELAKIISEWFQRQSANNNSSKGGLKFETIKY